MTKHLRVIGTTEEALLRAESQLGRVLLPFAEYGTGDCYCFDFARIGADG